ncbi:MULTISPECIES: patatin family protein [Aequorivita]|uniref:Patatin-like phospholipase family protein n=1 Tax=Aequorivita iocasae TaxID=2803865 RepID=A0ABX7DSJ9_9FLAO|nr:MULTISPECIES: patatin-like phospholipase family protein [Aequorivita]QQX76732.1 patatin-like phospholipase family protein [Aequorivita iocasae]UCA56204.1 patatin-like phospholipase family protein [Aequorivita sp. F7]
MRALVISGGGSKGAFAGGVAQYLMEKLHHNYDLFVGTSTGSLLISHLALDKVEKIKEVYTSVNQKSIFNSCPFVIKEDKFGGKQIAIDHFTVLRNFLKGKKTFGESLNLRKLIENTFTEIEFNNLKASKKEVVVTVSNLSLNQVEYKSVNDFEYQDFLDWIWISSNFTPFMSLVKKDGCEYADGGFGSMVPIEEAINRGATHIDIIVLETEITYYNRLPSKNVFSLLINMHNYMADRIEKQNIRIGKFVATNKDVIINLYYTPTVLTTNSLIFDKKMMTKWWELGFRYADQKNNALNEIRTKDD